MHELKHLAFPFKAWEI